MYILNEEVYIVLFSIGNDKSDHLSLKVSSLSEVMNYSMNHFCENYSEFKTEVLKVKLINLRKIKSLELDRSIKMIEDELPSYILKGKNGLRKKYIDYLFLKVLQEEKKLDETR